MSDNAASEAVPEITLGWRLRIAMERAGIKTDDMAHELGVHRGTVARWTHDVGAVPRDIYLQKWAALCGVPVTWLRGELYVDPTSRPTVNGASDTRRGTRSKTRRSSHTVRVFAVA